MPACLQIPGFAIDTATRTVGLSCITCTLTGVLTGCMILWRLSNLPPERVCDWAKVRRWPFSHVVYSHHDLTCSVPKNFRGRGGGVCL